MSRVGASLPSLPTAAGDWRLVGRTVWLVVSIPRYAALSLLAALAGLTLFVLTQNFEAAVFALTGDLPLGARVTILGGLYPFLGTVYERVTAVVLVALSALVGVDIAVATYHFREHGLSAREGTGSLLGVVLGALGAGCAACGTAVLAGVLSLAGATGLLALLPLEGLEFSLLAAAVMVLSLYWLADGMRGAAIDGCPVDV